MGDDLSDVIELLQSDSYVVTRPDPVVLVNGRRAAGTSSTFTIVASAQPASGRSIQGLPEGLRSSESMDVFTKTELRQARPDAGIDADTILIDGAVFEVVNVKRWNKLGNFYRATVVRLFE